MASKHTYEPSLDSCAITIHPKLELKYKILHLTGHKLSPAKAIEQICLQAVADVPLTRAEINTIEEEKEKNRQRRMANRLKVAAHNRGLVSGNFREGK